MDSAISEQSDNAGSSGPSCETSPSVADQADVTDAADDVKLYPAVAQVK